LDLDWQLLCEEMNVNGNDLRILSDVVNLDCIENSAFHKLFNDIRENGECGSSYDDSTDNFIFNKITLVLHTTIENKFIILTKHDSFKLENMLASYR